MYWRRKHTDPIPFQHFPLLPVLLGEFWGSICGQIVGDLPGDLGNTVASDRAGAPPSPEVFFLIKYGHFWKVVSHIYIFFKVMIP